MSPTFLSSWEKEGRDFFWGGVVFWENFACQGSIKCAFEFEMSAGNKAMKPTLYLFH